MMQAMQDPPGSGMRLTLPEAFVRGEFESPPGASGGDTRASKRQCDEPSKTSGPNRGNPVARRKGRFQASAKLSRIYCRLTFRP